MAGFGIQKDGLDSVIVKMDRAPAVYNAGDIFAGKVIVVCLETTPVKGIKVSQKWHTLILTYVISYMFTYVVQIWNII